PRKTKKALFSRAFDILIGLAKRCFRPLSHLSGVSGGILPTAPAAARESAATFSPRLGRPVEFSRTPPPNRGDPMANVLLGATGSVAAIKVPELFAELRRRGHAVRVVATRAATYFFDPAAIEPLAP